MRNYLLDISELMLEKHYDDFMPLFLANYSNKNSKLFYQSNSTTGFMIELDLSDPIVKREFYLIKSQLKKSNIKTLMNEYNTMIDILMTKKLSIKMIQELEINALTKCLLKACYDFNENDLELYSDDREISEYFKIKKWLKKNNNIFDYLLVFYEYHRNRERELPKNNKIIGLFEEYLEKNKEKFASEEKFLQLDSFNKEINDLNNKVDHLEKVIEIKKKNNKKLKQRMKKSSKRNKDIINKLKDEYLETIDQLKCDIKKITKEYEILKRKSVLKSEYNKKREEARLYLDELKSTKISLKNLEEEKETFEVNLLTVEKYLKSNGMTDDVRRLIALYDDALLTDNARENFINQHLYEIVYTVIEKGIHYFVDSDKNKKKLINLPENQYLENYQFIAVSSNDIFLNAFDCKFHEESSSDYAFKQIIQVNPIKVYGDNNALVELKGKKNNCTKGSIIKVNKCNEIEGEPSIKTEGTLHAIFESIIAKNHKLLYLEQKLSNGYVGYDLIKDHAIVIRDDFKVLTPSVVIIANNQLIKRMKMNDYFHDDLFFRNLTVVYYIEKNKMCYIQFTDGRRLNVDNFNNTYQLGLENGDVLGIDQFNNIIKKYNSNCEHKLTDEEKVLSFNQNKSQESISKNNEIIYDVKVLIVGNEAFGNRYLETFKNNGIEANFVAGHESYYKIETKAYDSNLILFITEAASHQNFYKLRDNFLEKMQFINYQGANRLVQFAIDCLGNH